MCVLTNEQAARLGSEGGEGSKHADCATAEVAAQPRGNMAPVPSRRGSTRPRVEQLLLFDIAGAATEPYPPARARRRAKAAVGGEGRADR